MDLSTPPFYYGNADDATDVTRALFWGSILDQKIPYFEETSRPNGKPLLDIIEPVKGYFGKTSSNYQVALFPLNDCLVKLGQRERSSVLHVAIAAPDKSTADATLAEIEKLLSPPQRLDGNVSLKFHYWAPHGPTYSEREIKVCSWNECRRNYSKNAEKELGELVNWCPDKDAGRIGVLHGPPGTGKTSVIRALLNEWHPWCEGNYVTDPERFFGESHYMMDVCLSSGEEGQKKKWQAIIIEDAEEFFSADAKSHVGQSLARLLNLGDGLIGQGLKIFFLMTTNVPLATMNPALMRPGRCYAHIHVPPLTAAEATNWLGKVSKEATLAELYANLHPIGQEVPVKNGAYL